MIARLALFLTLLAAPALAAPITIRSGEHAGFSRLVLPLPAGTDWSLARTPEGYLLSTSAREADFRIGGIFERIPKTRLLAVDPAKEGGLLFRTAVAIRAEAVLLHDNRLVIDFRTAPLPRPRRDLKTVEPEAVQPTPARPPPPGPALPGPEEPPADFDLFWRDLAPLGHGARDQPQLLAQPFPRHETADTPLSLPEVDTPDPRVAEVEAALLAQLARAAAQGLVEVDRGAAAAEGKGPSRQAHEAEISPVPDGQTASASAPPDHIPFRSLTAIDRDQDNLASSAGTGDRECPPDALLDFGPWMDGRSMPAHLAEARQGLLGEFDTPRQDKVLDLARTYLAFGFGAEARAVLQDMAEPDAQRDTLAYLAAILDDDATAAAMSEVRLTPCDGPVALWALLGADPLPEKPEVNFAAIQRGYGALPPPLRQAIGPRLVEKLLVLGAADVARSLQPQLARITGEDHEALDLVAARVALDPAAPEMRETLRDVVDARRPESVDTLLLLIEQRLTAQEVVERDLIASAEELAFELAGDPQAADLLRAAALGYGSSGEFDKGFAHLRDAAIDPDAAETRDTADRLVALLSVHPDDALFLRTVFAYRDRIEIAVADPSLRSALAGRLLDLGLADRAVQLIEHAPDIGDEDRRLLARAAQANRDPSAALAHLQGLDDDIALTLRAEAFARLGQHARARDAFLEAADEVRAREESRRAGAWIAPNENSDPAVARFTEIFATPDKPASDHAGPVTRARHLLDTSRTERETLRELLDRLGS
ncbi:hypothetical protein [Thioclava atlantica]|uniref:Uncharacterized protein n=1 Tax=Thioclava atlantica TaxID=1317124 RepID=A0A085TVK8_9RHOB|nr:hypothetical protein [Thioclava atlantica]KFE34755.1 hypothetical protein DW2_11136 [Thioclava atlantica]